MERASSYFVIAGNIRDTTKLSSQNVANFIDSIVLNINSTNEQVIGNIIKVATELQPRSSSADVVSGALSFHLKMELHYSEVY